jgi:hypothetical protein
VDSLDTPATPLVFNASIDTTNMANVVLIDSTLADKQIFYDSVNANTFPIIYDYNSKTDDLLALFRQKFPASYIQRISLAFHDKGTNFMAGFMNNKPLFQEIDLAEGQTSFSDNVSFLVSCIKEFHVSHIDFLACNTLQYSNWKSYYRVLAAQTSVVVGASNDQTGNLNHGGDWVMESTHENVRDMYFNANISNYASTLVLSTITLNGANGNVGLRMNTGVIEYYNTTTSTWTAIGSGNWPVQFVNSNLSSVLRVVFTQSLTINAGYGGTAGYFIAGSSYITFDGSNNFINITSIPLYPGFIQNGSTATSTNGYANVIVQNIKTNVTGTSTLNGAVSGSRAGWICAGSFGRGAAANQIINCSNNGVISTNACGGICGDRPGTLGGSVTFTNCTNTGAVSGTGAGGISGASAGRFSGSATFVNCTNSGNISGSSAGGIAANFPGLDNGSTTFTGCTNSGTISGLQSGGVAGYGAGETGSASFTNCANSGTISGVQTGGIAGYAAGSSGSATFTNCTNTGLISGQNAGGIAGQSAGEASGSVSFTGCTNNGNITNQSSGGIAGAYAGASGSCIITNCFSTGLISGQYAGGIAGGFFAYNTSNTCTITACYSTGAISGNNAGGIVGSDVGYNNNALYTPVVNITNSYSLGTIATTCGGICGGTNGGAYTNTPSITITNCYSAGTIVNANSGIVSTSYPKTTTQRNVYAAAGVWVNSIANANLTGAPTNFNTPGITWTMVSPGNPYVLSLYNAAIYTSSSVSSGTSPYTSAASVFGSVGYTYIIININQVANVATTKVFAYKGTAPNYNSYNYNTFTLTDTNGVSSPGKMSSSIVSTTGVLTISKSANNISVNGSGNSIYLRMSGFDLQYSVVGSAPVGWTTIPAWPMTLTNSNPVPSSVLRVVATQALSISSSTGGTNGYFIAGSPYITFDGSGNTITISSIPSYLGLIQNGLNTAGTNGFANVVVQNFTTAISGTSTLAIGAGWLCQRFFGRNVSANAIMGCTNSSTGVISTTSAGGIAGFFAGTTGGSLTFIDCTNNGEVGNVSISRASGIAGENAGRGGGSVTFINCTNSGAISGSIAGGITGLFAASFCGSVTFTNCTNSGAITQSQSGGIVGPQSAELGGSVTFTGCTNSGVISGSSAGGIAGTRAGWFNGFASFTNCTNSGNISGLSAGGIAGSIAGATNGSVTITNCTNSGTISRQYAGGIAGANAGQSNGLVTITNCFSTGVISGQNAGGIAGDWFGYNTSINCVISQCYSTGDITGNNAGGIVGSDVGLTDNALYTPNVNITNCYSQGAVSTTAGGICGGTDGSTYAASPTITITNCYSAGTIVDANSGLVSILYPKPTSKPNTYVAAGTWSDAAANANLTGTPTNISTNNPGSTWTTLGSNTPYVLSAYNAALYSPSSASTSSSTYTSTAGLFSPEYNYKLMYTDQVGDEKIAYVLVYKGTAPYYYSYNVNTFILSIANGFYVTSVTIDPYTGVLSFNNSPTQISMRNAPMISGGGGAFWFGRDGFLFKGKGGGGARRSTKMAPGGNTTCNGPTYIYNKYKPGGGGVGASSVANRRAKNRLATSCGDQNSNKCFPCYTTLGQYSNYTHNPNGYVPCLSRPSSRAPGAPNLNSLIPANGQLTLDFTLGPDGGSPIIDIQYSTNNGITWISSGQTSSPIVVTGLINGVSYPVVVRAINMVGASPSSNVIFGTPATAPSAPTLNSLTPGNGQLTLNFTLGSNGGSAITDIEYSTNNGATWSSSGQTSSPIVVTGLTNAVTYQVAVRAKNAFGTSPSSNVVSGNPATTPSAPTLNSLTPSNGQLTLIFTLGSNGGSAITDIEYSTNNGATWIPSGATSSPIVVTGLTNGVSYPVAVRAKNVFGTSPSSNVISGTPIPIAPSAPTLNSLTPSNGKLTLNFTLGSNGGSAITNIEYSTNNGSTWISSGQTASPVVATGLTNGVSYPVAVRAINIVGTSPSSNVISGTPNASINTFSAVGTTTWLAPTGVTSVEYLVVAGGGGSGGGYDTGGGGGGGAGMVLSGTISVTPGTSYNIVVGDGGAQGTSNRGPPPIAPVETNGSPGVNSIFGSITALGGGGGYASRQRAVVSSGGGTQVSGSSTASTGGSGGGSAADLNGAGGGGGGNTSNGGNGVANVGGSGGSGVANSISGVSLTYGVGGRGANGDVTTGNQGVAGASNTGNGARGGGTRSGEQTNGAKGGSGIVIITF